MRYILLFLISFPVYADPQFIWNSSIGCYSGCTYDFYMDLDAQDGTEGHPFEPEILIKDILSTSYVYTQTDEITGKPVTVAVKAKNSYGLESSFSNIYLYTFPFKGPQISVLPETPTFINSVFNIEKMTIINGQTGEVIQTPP